MIQTSQFPAVYRSFPPWIDDSDSDFRGNQRVKVGLDFFKMGLTSGVVKNLETSE